MRFFHIPKNNFLSHVVNYFAMREFLAGRGHEVLNAVNGKYSQFLSWLGIDCFILLDSQEIDEAPFRTTLWFKYPHRITVCINEEVALLRNFNPDRVRGVFRFTTSKLKYNLSPNFHHLWILTK
jgi:UDP:flavonoid glycosyltransferase YjiC (YdhE family)